MGYQVFAGVHKTRAKLVILAALVIVLSFLAPGGGTAQVGAVETLTLDEAINRALESNLMLRQLKEERESASARRSSAASRGDFATLMEADLQEDLASIQLAEQRRVVVGQVYQAYYGIKLAEAALEVHKAALADAEETLRVARKGYEAGVSTMVDVLGAEAYVAQAAAAVEGAEKDLEVAWLGLNQLMNDPFDQRYQLTTILSKNLPYTDDLDKAIERAIEHDAAVRTAARRMQFFEDVPGTGGWMPALMAKRAAEQDVERRVRQAYLEMWTAYSQLDPFEKAVQLAEEQLRLASMRFDAGVGTHAEVLSARRQLTEAQLGRLQALFELNRARSQFRLLTEPVGSRG